MNPMLPDKASALVEQVTQMILPAALRAAGSTLVTFGRQEDDAPSEKKSVFINHFSAGIRQLFQELLVETSKSGNSATPHRKAGGGKADLEERISKYSLMDKEILEAQIAAERLSASLDGECQFALDCFSMRLEKLLAIRFSREQNPLRSKKLTLLFRESCDQLSPTSHASDVAMKNWGDILKKHYAEWLDSINESLIQQRILPNLDWEDVEERYEEKQKEKAREIRQNLITEITGQAPANGEVNNSQLMEGIYRMLSQAAQTQPDISKHIIEGSQLGPRISRPEVIATLDQIAVAPVINPQTGYRELATDQTLTEQIAGNTDLSSRMMDEQTRNSISLLSMMFDKLQQEEQIATPIKPLLNELQIPVLKQAISDETFFSSHENPAQELVNEIARAGAHWVPKENVGKDPFYRKISSIVSDVAAADGSNAAVFDNKLEELKEFLDKEERRAALLEERIIKAELAKARTESAKSRADSIIASHVAKVAGLPGTCQFLQDAWSHVLFFHINRDEDEPSASQQRAIALTDLLVDARNHRNDCSPLFREMAEYLHDVGKDVPEQTFRDIQAELQPPPAAARPAPRPAMAASPAVAPKTAAATPAPASATPASTTPATTSPVTTPAKPAEPLTAPDIMAVDTLLTSEPLLVDDLLLDDVFSLDPDSVLLQDGIATIEPLDIPDSSAVDSNPISNNTSPGTSASADDDFVFSLDIDEPVTAVTPASSALTDLSAEIADILGETAQPAASQPATAPPAVEAAPVMVEDSSDDGEFAAIVDGLRANTWLRMTTDNNDSIKVKLAAIIKHNGNYIFVNREGVKVINTDRAGVIALFRDQRLTVVDDAIFFDRALESVIHSLRR